MLLQRWKPATAHNRYRGLHAFYGWLEEEDDLPSPMAWGSTYWRCATSLHGPGDRRSRLVERECGELRICDEYLQQCQQTDLLPDQRWVQLISLDRHGLEMEPSWRDALSARNIVAPGAAAIDLGLRVARAVTS
jgi:hypothetical protein